MLLFPAHQGMRGIRYSKDDYSTPGGGSSAPPCSTSSSPPQGGTSSAPPAAHLGGTTTSADVAAEVFRRTVNDCIAAGIERALLIGPYSGDTMFRHTFRNVFQFSPTEQFIKEHADCDPGMVRAACMHGMGG